MGSRALDELLEDLILETGIDNVTFVGANERNGLLRRVEGLGIEVDFVDSDPKFDNPRDAVFDDIEFNELVVVFNAEKHYPIGRLIDREMIVVGDDEKHNGDCNPIDSFDKIIEQNSIKEVHSKHKIDKWWIVHGHSVVNS